MLQVVEAAEACAKVVKRKPTTQLGKSCSELLRTRDVGNGGRLRHLQHEIHGVDTVLAQLVLDDRQQLRDRRSSCRRC